MTHSLIFPFVVLNVVNMLFYTGPPRDIFLGET